MQQIWTQQNYIDWDVLRNDADKEETFQQTVLSDSSRLAREEQE